MNCDVVSVRDNTAGTNHIEYSNYTALGQPGSALSPKPSNIAVRTNYTYDPNMGRLNTLVTQKLDSGTPVATYQNLAYQYDLKGNITTLMDTVNSLTHAYAYDYLDRLLSAAGTGQNPYSQTYAYDRIGNITSKSDVVNYAKPLKNWRLHAKNLRNPLFSLPANYGKVSNSKVSTPTPTTASPMP